jgi:hypothetical protein
MQGAPHCALHLPVNTGITTAGYSEPCSSVNGGSVSGRQHIAALGLMLSKTFDMYGASKPLVRFGGG